MDKKELYHNYSEMEWNQQNCFEKEWEQKNNLILMLRKVKSEMEFNKKVYRKKVIIEKYL